MRFALVGLMLLVAAPAADSKSPKSQCKDRCQINYKSCLKRTTTNKGRAQCKAQRVSCKGTCGGK